MSIHNLDELSHYIRSAKIDEFGSMQVSPAMPFDVYHEKEGIYRVVINRMPVPGSLPTIMVTANTERFNANATAILYGDGQITVHIYDSQNVHINCAFDIVVIYPF